MIHVHLRGKQVIFPPRRGLAQLGIERVHDLRDYRAQLRFAVLTQRMTHSLLCRCDELTDLSRRLNAPNGFPKCIPSHR